MNPYKYLFEYKIEVPADRLTNILQPPENVLQRRFIKKHLRKDMQTAINEANALVKRYYDSKHRWKEFDVGDQV